MCGHWYPGPFGLLLRTKHAHARPQAHTYNAVRVHVLCSEGLSLSACSCWLSPSFGFTEHQWVALHVPVMVSALKIPCARRGDGPGQDCRVGGHHPIPPLQANPGVCTCAQCDTALPHASTRLQCLALLLETAHQLCCQRDPAPCSSSSLS